MARTIFPLDYRAVAYLSQINQARCMKMGMCSQKM